MPKARDPNRPHQPSSQQAKSLFTDRINETSRFIELLNAPQGSPLPLLMFYGVGGAGKTTLIKHLQEKCDELKVPWAAVDLAEAREADEALSRLAAQLEQRHGIRFKGFKQAMAVLAAKETGAAVTPKVAEHLSASSHIAGIALEALGLIPVIGPIAIALKLGKDATQLALGKVLKSNRGFREAVAKMGGRRSSSSLSGAMRRSCWMNCRGGLRRSLPPSFWTGAASPVAGYFFSISTRCSGATSAAGLSRRMPGYGFCASTCMNAVC